MKVDLDLKGLEKAISKIKDYEINKKNAVSEVVRETAFKVQANAKQRAPVKSGNLKRSINTKVSDDGMSAEVGTSIEYAPHQEFGTKDHEAQPFLFPAHEEEKNEYKQKLKEVLSDR